MAEDGDDPLIIDIAQRLARVEEKVSMLEKHINRVDNRVWMILAAVLIGIAINIALQLAG